MSYQRSRKVHGPQHQPDVREHAKKYLRNGVSAGTANPSHSWRCAKAPAVHFEQRADRPGPAGKKGAESGCYCYGTRCNRIVFMLVGVSRRQRYSRPQPAAIKGHGMTPEGRFPVASVPISLPSISYTDSETDDSAEGRS